MLIIPVQPVPSQIFNVQLNGQSCQINLYQQSRGLFLDLYVNNALIIAGQICQNFNRIVRSLYLGFQGDLMIGDFEGVGIVGSDPDYTGLGTRFKLIYIEPSDLPAGVG